MHKEAMYWKCPNTNDTQLQGVDYAQIPVF